MESFFRNIPLKISLAYFLIASLWILVTDYSLFLIFKLLDSKLISFEVYKGLFFVFSTTVLLFVLLKKNEKLNIKNKIKLIEGEQKYKRFIDQLNEGIYSIEFNAAINTKLTIDDQITKIKYHSYLAECNHAYLKIHGANHRKQLVGKSILELHFKSGNDFLKKFIESGYEIKNEESKIIDENGNLRYFLNNMVGFINDDGFLVNCWGTAMDITQIKSSEIRLELAVEGAELGIWDWYIPTGKVIINKRWAEMIEYNQDEINDHISSWEKLVNPEDNPKVIQDLNDHLEGKTHIYKNEHRLKTKSGKWKWILDIGKVTERDDDGKPIRATGIHLDISEIKEAEKKLKENNFELIKTNEELDNFVYRVSHDLRSPITSSLGLARLSQRENSVSILNQYAKMQEKSLVKLDKFIKDILDFSRNSRTDLSPEKINFLEIINDLLEDLFRINENKQVDININLNQHVDFFSDIIRVRIILNNIITNAYKYQNPYEKSPFINIIIKVDLNKSIINITDNGVGIHKDHHDHLFKMFYRATDKMPGSGIGLYIVQDCIKKLNGNIKIDSEINKGSSFIIQIPNMKEKIQKNKTGYGNQIVI